MLLIILKKMLSNKWMVLCLLIGSILVVAMVSSIPIYTDGILQRMLTRDLENYQVASNVFPGRYLIKSDSNFSTVNGDYSSVSNLDKMITEKFAKDYKLPIITQTQNLVFDYLTALPEVQKEEDPKGEFLKLEALSELQDHVKILHGRMFSPKTENGIYEVIATESAIKDLKLMLNEVYSVDGIVKNVKEPIKIRVVGIFTMKDADDPYWFQHPLEYKESVLVDFDLCIKNFVENNAVKLTEYQWYFAFDYHKIALSNVKHILNSHEFQSRWFSQYIGSLEFKMPAIPILEQYYEREKQLKITLWVLVVPILIMLAFYIFMVSQLIINHEENEIAVFKSRGASRLQIFLSYLVESLILSGVALLAGPYLGLLLCKVLGASNGFLEFVNRTALPLNLNLKAYTYSIWALILFIITMLIPALLASRISIVQYKQSKSRSAKIPVWKKYFLDIVILAVSGYGLYRYNKRQMILNITGIKGTQLEIDPLLFLISTFFILGAGLLFLRIFPYLVSFIFYMGRKIWSPVLYASFIQVGRSGGQEQFLMLFIILSLSIGIFNANAARTINRNIQDKIRYDIGADITLQPYWDSNKPNNMDMPPGGSLEQISSGNSLFQKEPLKYIEPDFTPYTKLSGVEKATKVFVKDKIKAEVGQQRVGNVRIMGIIPNEFAQVAWFRQDLLPHHWYEYLNLIVDSPKAFLVSKTFKDMYDAREGDSIYISWGDQNYLEGTIYAFIDYWPSFNPNAVKEGSAPPSLVVANLSYIQNKCAMEPYQVWIAKKPEASDTQVNNDIKDKKLEIDSIRYANQEIIRRKNDPMLQGTNGALTLGFVVTMAISAIGFLIYWTLSIRKRVLQFGIFRAMGLSLRKVIGMLVCEQFLISGTAIIMGILVGGLTSDLFVPLFQIIYSSVEQVPPFKVLASGDDYIKIYAIVAVMLISGFAVLGRFVSRIRIDQAVKLGED